MRDHELFGLALGLGAPWAVTEVRFDVRTHRLDLTVDFTEGSRFPCPVCGHAACLVYDIRIRTWRHLNFFQYQTYLTARVPRVQCLSCGVHRVPVRWAREGTGFTTLFETLLLDLARRPGPSSVTGAGSSRSSALGSPTASSRA